MKKDNLLALLLVVCIMFIAIASPVSAAWQNTSLDKRAQEIVGKMSINEKIGQVLMVNLGSDGSDAQGNAIGVQECNEAVVNMIQDYHIGNVILFSESVQDTKLAVRLVDDLQTASIEGGGLPLLIGIDQEGGSVARLGQGTCLPGNMAIGASGKLKNARIAGALIGKELASIGINCNFAPVADVNDNPKNPVIHLRSFSFDPNIVAKMSAEYRAGLAEQGIITSAKHFPGHGNTSVDTHFGLAVVNKTKAEWEAVEAVPFRSMINSGVDIIMSAHIQYPKLDDTKYKSKLTGEELYLPATLSHKILTGLLRQELKFEGVIVTDAMSMDAIINNFGIEEACVLALAAGADLLCNPILITSAEKLDKIFTQINLALTDGRLTQERLDEAALRVIRLKINWSTIRCKQLCKSPRFHCLRLSRHEL